MNTDDIFKQIKNITDNNMSGSEKTLTSIDFTPNNSGIIGAAREHITESYKIDPEISKKYNRYGLNWNPKDYYSGNLDIQLAAAQSNWAKLGNSLSQTIVSELGLGTVKAFSDLVDVIGQAIGISDHDYSNPVSAKLEEWQEAFRNEVAPIYSRPGSGFGNGTDFGWWMQNFPSVASTITLLIPGTAASKGIGLLGKGAKSLTKETKLAKTWNKVVGEKTKVLLNEGSNLLVNAGVQRTLENYQEARIVYNQILPEIKQELNKKLEDGTYDAFIKNNEKYLEDVSDKNNTSEVAKAIARVSADKTFRFDFWNTAFDVLQLAALRGVSFNAFGKTAKTPAGRRYDIQSRKFAGKYKTKEELDNLIKNRKTWEKAKDKFADIGYYVGTTGLIESTEGIEEALNYVASEEGLHLGRTIIGIDANNSVLSDRLNQYLHNPELWENAFWGLAGGVIFRGLADAAISGKTARNKKKLEKETNDKINITTGENTHFGDNWSQYFETADTYRMKTAVDARIASEARFQEQMTKLNKENKDPFEPGRIVKSEEEKQVLRERLLQQRRDKIILNAMDSGTINMLESYFSDKNVQNALVEQGIIKQKELQNIQTKDLAEIKKLKQEYNKIKKQVLDEANNLKKEGKTIPLEYLQIIVRNNVENKLLLDEYNKQLNKYEEEAAQLENSLNNKLDKDIDYKSIVKQRVLSQILGQLEAEKSYILSENKIRTTIEGQERLRQIDSNIESVKNSIIDLDKENSIANLMLAIESSYYRKYNENGEYSTDKSSKKGLEFSKARENNDKEYFKNIDKRLIDLSDSHFQQAKVIEDRIVKTLGDDYERSIPNISKTLGTAYEGIAALQYQISSLENKLKYTSNELLDEAKYLHNSFNVIRKAKIDESFEDIKDLAGTYGSEKIAKYINSYLHNPKELKNIKDISENDTEALKRALDILNLTSSINENIEEDIYRVLKDYDDIKAAQNQNSSTSQKADTSVQNKSVNNNKQTDENSVENANKAEKNGKSDTSNNENAGKPKYKLNDIQGIGSYEEYTPGIYTIKLQPGDNNNDLIFSNPDLFSQEQGVSVIDGNFIVVLNPQIDKDGNVVRVGVLGLDTEENRAKAEQNNTNDEQSSVKDTKPDILSTGEVDENLPPIDNDDDDDEEELNNKTKSIDIAKAANDALMKIAENENATIDDNFLNQLRTTLQNTFNPDNSEVVNDMIESQIESVKQIAKEFDIYKPIGEAINALQQSSISDIDNETRKTSRIIFNKAIDELIEKNKNVLGVDEINGKSYINVESLLRFCNKVSHNNAAAQILYEATLNYINNSNKYIIVDSKPNNALKNIETKTPALLDVIDVDFSINFDGFYRNLVRSENSSKQVINEINNLKIGDFIDYKKENRVIKFYRNNVQIGYLPIPSRYNGKLTQLNDNWITDVEINNGVVASDLQDLFIKWISNPNNDEDIKKLYNIILEYSYCKNSTRRGELLELFKNNKEYNKEEYNKYKSDNPLIDDDADLIRLEGLAKLWKYVKDKPNLEEEDNKNRKVNGIHSWFEDMVAPSFSFVTNLANKEKGSISVSDITEGSRIETSESEASYAKNALGERYKKDGKIDSDKVKLGLSLNGKVTTSGNADLADTNVFSVKIGSGNTFAILLSRNGSHDMIHAFSQKMNPAMSKNEAIRKGITNKLKELIENKNIEELGSFLYRLFGTNHTTKKGFFINDYNGLFSPKKGILNVYPIKNDNNNIVGYEIYSKENNSTVKVSISTNNDGGLTIYSYKNGELKELDGVKDVEELVDIIFSGNVYFNIGLSLLNIDNNRGSTNGFFKINEKGKLVVEIGSFKQEYDSFNDFALNSDFIKLTTKPSKDGFGNHDRFGENDGPIQTIKVKNNVSNTISTTPLRNNNNNNNKIESEDIISILNNKSTNKGFAIAKLLNSRLANSVSINNFYARLFPKNVIFVNESIDAYGYANTSNEEKTLSNTSKTKVPAGFVVFGKEWLDELVNNGESGRKEAIRKLIHENIHLTLSDENKRHFVEDIRVIFDEFARKNKNEEAKVYLFNSTDAHKQRYYNEDGTINEEGLEEFLVESLTSGTLANALNNIESTDEKEHKTLFGKIIDFLLNLFNWNGVSNINKNSLYTEELEIINGLFNTTTKKETNINNEKETNTNNEKELDKDNKTIEQNTESNEFKEFEDTDDLLMSNIKETKDDELLIPSIKDFINLFSVEEQPEILNRLNNGEISIKC